MLPRPKPYGKRGCGNKSAKLSTSICKQLASYSDQSRPQREPCPLVGSDHHSGLRLSVADHVGSGRLLGYSYGALVCSRPSAVGYVPQHHPYSAVDLPPIISYTGTVHLPRGKGATHANIQQRLSQAFQWLTTVGR